MLWGKKASSGEKVAVGYQKRGALLKRTGSVENTYVTVFFLSVT